MKYLSILLVLFAFACNEDDFETQDCFQAFQSALVEEAACILCDDLWDDGTMVTSYQCLEKSFTDDLNHQYFKDGVFGPVRLKGGAYCYYKGEARTIKLEERFNSVYCIECIYEECEITYQRRCFTSEQERDEEFEVDQRFTATAAACKKVNL